MICKQWRFDVACSDGGAHTVTEIGDPIRCQTCGVEAVEIMTTPRVHGTRLDPRRQMPPGGDSRPL